MSPVNEHIDLTGDKPVITNINNKILKKEVVDLYSDSSTSVDTEWDIVQKRAIKSINKVNHIPTNLSDTDSFDSCDGFIEKGGLKLEENLGKLGFNFRISKVPNNITINNYNNNINLTGIGNSSGSGNSSPINITINTDREKQEYNPNINLQNNSSSGDSTPNSLLKPARIPTAHSGIQQFTNLLQNPTSSYVLPEASRIGTKSTKNSNTYESDPTESDKKPSARKHAKNPTETRVINSDSDTGTHLENRQLSKTTVFKNEYWSDDSVEIVVPETKPDTRPRERIPKRSRKRRKRGDIIRPKDKSSQNSNASTPDSSSPEKKYFAEI